MSKQMLNRQWLAERPYIIAIIISLVLVLWMVSGASGSDVAKDEPAQTHQEKHAPIPKVQVETLHAESVFDVIDLYGRTEPDRQATVKAENAGQIIEVLAERGARVKQGEVIALIDKNDLPDRLVQSKSLLAQREIEYQGALKLNRDGYQGQVQVSTAEANLKAAKAQVVNIEIALENTTVRAPFDGVMNTRYVEQGDYVKVGDNVAMIADLDPLIVRAHVTESQVSNVELDQIADIQLLNKQNVKGKVRYIASVADDATNTFKIEVAVENADYQLLAGLSSEVEIALEKTNAIKVTPALLALDEQGNIGIKTVVGNKVKFTDINVVKSETDGIWLSGLGEQADIITLGQGFVREGDEVEAIYAQVTKG